MCPLPSPAHISSQNSRAAQSTFSVGTTAFSEQQTASASSRRCSVSNSPPDATPTCIAACQNGSIHILSLHTSEELLQIHTPSHRALCQHNLSLHYSRPFLFTTSNVISQISPKHVDSVNARELWEYGVDELSTKNYSGGEGEGACIIAPFWKQELLVAWPDAGVCTLGRFRSSVIALPECSGLLPAEAGAAIRALAAGEDVFVTAACDDVSFPSPRMGGC
jgi:hypothetical protein